MHKSESCSLHVGFLFIESPLNNVHHLLRCIKDFSLQQGYDNTLNKVGQTIRFPLDSVPGIEYSVFQEINLLAFLQKYVVSRINSIALKRPPA